MTSLPKLIMNQVAGKPEGTLLCPSALLHLGNRAAIDQALARLSRTGRLIRVCQGVYVRPIETRFGSRPPGTEEVIEALAKLWGESIVPSGGAAANSLGLTTQVPVRSVYLTSGPNRKLTLGKVEVELRHAPRWQMAAPKRLAGDVIRAMSWLGPNEAAAHLKAIRERLSLEDFQELSESRAVMPAWLAEPVSTLVANG